MGIDVVYKSLIFFENWPLKFPTFSKKKRVSMFGKISFLKKNEILKILITKYRVFL